MAPLKSYKPLRRKKPLTAKTRLKRTMANPAKKVVGRRPMFAERIKAQNERAKAKMHEFFGYACMCCGQCSQTCTIHHGIRVSQSWYHRFTPMNWHWICRSCHARATKTESLYNSELNLVRPDLVAFIVNTPYKRQKCKHTLGNMALIEQWMDTAVKTHSYGELVTLPTWQEVNGLEADNV